MRRLNPRETIDLIRRAAETWRGIEVDEDLIEDGLVHAVFGLKCTAGDEEPEPLGQANWCSGTVSRGLRVVGLAAAYPARPAHRRRPGALLLPLGHGPEQVVALS